MNLVGTRSVNRVDPAPFRPMSLQKLPPMMKSRAYGRDYAGEELFDPDGRRKLRKLRCARGIYPAI